MLPLISHPRLCPPAVHEPAGASEFPYFSNNWNPRGSQYVILMGSKALKHGIQTFWFVSRGDDFLLNDINPTYPVWNLINTFCDTEEKMKVPWMK